VPYLPELPEPGLRLELEPPAAGPVFAFGQPVLLGVSLHNQTGTRFEFGADPLDPKTGGVEVLIRRVTGGRGDPAAGEVFVPMMRACLAEDESTRVSLPPGGVLRNNLNLTYGSGGFAFAEPGSYELVPLLGLPYQLPGAGWVERLVRGPALRVRVGYPHTPAAERDALVLLRPDVGAWFALGGSDCLARAADDLAELSDRRRAVDPADPVAAGIVRAAGINAGREFLRLRDGRVEHRSGDPHRAAELLASLDPPALRNFDPQTAAGTAALARHYASQARG
jgi:hypothetical protein